MTQGELNGRDRRRQGWINTLRRASYGLLLWLGQQEAQSADAPAKLAHAPPGRLSLSTLAVPPGAFSKPADRYSTDSHRWQLSAGPEPVIPLLRLRSGKSLREVRRLKDGLGLDLSVQDDLSLHLALHPKRDQLQPGSRWSLNTGAETNPAKRPLWSFGGSVDMVKYSDARNPHERDQRVHCAAQLLLDADRLTGLPGDAVVTLQHAYWQSGAYYPDEAVWQFRMRWRF